MAFILVVTYCVNIDCGYSLESPQRDGSYEYPQSMFSNKNKKNNVYPCKPQFYYIKVGFKGVNIIQAYFRDEHVYSLFLKQTTLKVRSFLHKHIQSKLNSSNTDGSFSMANTNSFLSNCEILPIAQENKDLGKCSYFTMKLFVLCTH